MITQKKLIEMRDDLYKRFSYFTSRTDVTAYVDKTMSNHLFPYYSEDTCKRIYKDALDLVKENITDKYKNDLITIKKYVEELDCDFSNPSSYSCENNGELFNLLVGTSAGLGAAVILGGPALLFAAIGMGLMGAYNSRKRKEELISKIIDASRKMNDEAINALRKILDTLIIDEEPIECLPFNSEEVINENILTKEQKEIRDFLKERNITTLVHFTDESAYKSILEHGICSRKEAQRRNIPLKIYDNSDLNTNARSIMKSSVDDYVYLSITSVDYKLRTTYRINRGLTKDKIIYIDASILWKEIDSDIIYIDMNAVSRSASYGKDINAFRKLFKNVIVQEKDGESKTYTREAKATNQPTCEQAQILIEKRIDPKYILNKKEVNTKPDYYGSDLPF